MTAFTVNSVNGAATSRDGAQNPVVDIQVVMISTKKAAHWLEKYKGPNRRTSDIQVLKFQADMEAGRWHFEGAPIKISKTGKLLDGKHRLTALANTIPEMEIPFVVIRGLDDDAQLYMDQGQVRTVGQQLGLRGIGNASLYAAASKLYLDWTRNRLFKSTTRGCTSKPEITEWVLNNQRLLAKISETDFSKVDAPASVTGAFALAIIQSSPVRAAKFLKQLHAGTGLQEGDPILALDRRLRNIRKSGTRVSQREYLALFIKAWNAWVMGDRMQKLQTPAMTEETFPELVTVIEPDISYE